jgi:hypothetical protein
MGTDIHLQVQRRNSEGTWETVNPPLGYNDHDEWILKNYKEAVAKLPEGVTEADVLAGNPEEFDWNCYYIRKYHQNWYNGRNYNLFAMLADVRNGRGFAGVQTGAGFNPIAEPRGLPDDVTPGHYDEEVEDFVGGFNFGDHSFSHLTLKELLDYDWDQTTALCCYIPLSYYAVRKETGDTSAPEWGSGGIWGQGIEMIDADEADRLLATRPNLVTEAQRQAVRDRLNGMKKSTISNDFGHIDLAEKKYYVREWWTETYRDCAGEFYTHVIPALQKIDPNPENVRIVFGFDS